MFPPHLGNQVPEKCLEEDHTRETTYIWPGAAKQEPGFDSRNGNKSLFYLSCHFYFSAELNREKHLMEEIKQCKAPYCMPVSSNR